MKYDKFIGDNNININKYEGCHILYSYFLKLICIG